MDITIVIDYDEYVLTPVQIRPTLVKRALLKGFLIAKQRCIQKSIDIGAIASAVESVLHLNDVGP